jgi:hypothetical protein
MFNCLRPLPITHCICVLFCVYLFTQGGGGESLPERRLEWRQFTILKVTILKRRRNEASILTSFTISKRNEPAYSRTCKDRSDANPVYYTLRKSEAKRILFIPQIRKIEAERTLFIPQIGQTKAKRRLFIPQIRKNEAERVCLFHKLDRSKRSKVCLFYKFERTKRSKVCLFHKFKKSKRSKLSLFQK